MRAPAITTTMAKQLEFEQEIERLLFNEARLLDEARYDDWLELYTQEAVYWVPAGTKPLEEIDPEWEVSLIYDDWDLMNKRVARLNSPYAYAQKPASRTQRILSNIVIDFSEGKDKCVVSSSYCCYELRAHKMTTFIGRCEHTLVREDKDWKITKKVVDLITRDEVVDSLTFIL
ncbi:MAG: aromatic-ring-hydroxylating dioxygenase subunit beta [Chloroflexi bacterium]|nr:aromatic-ring-hydroxylating dioxygenase subunit beta [Chloroflexota bacterium]